jgi:hypothetical protein
MLDTAKVGNNPQLVPTRRRADTADARLDRRARHLAAITPHVPEFVCRNLLILADRDSTKRATTEAA